MKTEAICFNGSVQVDEKGKIVIFYTWVEGESDTLVPNGAPYDLLVEGLSQMEITIKKQAEKVANKIRLLKSSRGEA